MLSQSLSNQVYDVLRLVIWGIFWYNFNYSAIFFFKMLFGSPKIVLVHHRPLNKNCQFSIPRHLVGDLFICSFSYFEIWNFPPFLRWWNLGKEMFQIQSLGKVNASFFYSTIMVEKNKRSNKGLVVIPLYRYTSIQNRPKASMH